MNNNEHGKHTINIFFVETSKGSPVLHLNNNYVKLWTLQKHFQQELAEQV